AASSPNAGAASASTSTPIVIIVCFDMNPPRPFETRRRLGRRSTPATPRSGAPWLLVLSDISIRRRSSFIGVHVHLLGIIFPIRWFGKPNRYTAPRINWVHTQVGVDSWVSAELREAAPLQ